MSGGGGGGGEGGEGRRGFLPTHATPRPACPLPPPRARRFSDVHRVRAGLWSRQANITQSFDDGDWGKIFRETAPGEAGLPAYSVADIAAKYNIPAFDYVKIDIEGEPGARFLPPGPPAHVDPAQPAATCPWRLCRRGAPDRHGHAPTTSRDPTPVGAALGVCWRRV